MADYLILPEVSGSFKEAYRKLNLLQLQCATLNEVAKGVREGKYNISPAAGCGVEEILKQLAAIDPKKAEQINPKEFKFTGKAVIVNEEEFFNSYFRTEEGKRYYAMMKEFAPMISKKLAKVRL